MNSVCLRKEIVGTLDTDSSNPRRLKQHLLSSLSSQPTSHNIHLTILNSQPKRTTSIYPHTPNPPRCLQQEYLVTLSADVEGGDDQTLENLPVSSFTAEAATVSEPGSATNATSRDKTSKKRILLSAISAYLYTFPQSSSSILYISKVDSSSYTPSPKGETWSSSPTRRLIIAFITYFLRSSTRHTETVRCQLFARSQNQYLFSNSVQSGQKKVLGGLGLCGWWKGVYEAVAEKVVSPVGVTIAAPETGGMGSQSLSANDKIHLSYLLPSYSASEASGMLRPSREPLPSGLFWKYEPPFTTPVYHSSSPLSSSLPSLATLIPSLPDDPKTRFLDEMISEGVSSSSTGERVVKFPRSDINESGSIRLDASSERRNKASRKKEEAAGDEAERKTSHSILSRTKPDEFWERMGFRQECASGDVTGFFTLIVGPESASLAVHQKGDATIPEADVTEIEESQKASSSAPSGEIVKSSLLPQAILDRLLTALLNIDFKSRDLAIEGTALWESAVKSIASDEVGLEAFERDCVGTIEATQGSEVVVKRPREEVVVTMLQPRKKKK